MDELISLLPVKDSGIISDLHDFLKVQHPGTEKKAV